MNSIFLNQLYNNHKDCPKCPTPDRVSLFFTGILSVLFPDFSSRKFGSENDLHLHILSLKEELHAMLEMHPNLEKSKDSSNSDKFFNNLPAIHKRLENDAIAIYEGDPAATSITEVIKTYPGFYAIAAYRIAHELHSFGVKIIPRIITEFAHSKTGVDIHPGAKIGSALCIDHGTGIVIGETSEIGNNVKIYQGVTLGALSVAKKDAYSKRHPTIEDNVILYSGATVLGGDTVIGHDSIIGGNTWITNSIAPNSKIYYHDTSQHEDRYHF